MLINHIKGDIFTTKDKHIIFAINKEGKNGGFAGQVAKKGFTELIDTGGNELGDIIDKTIDGITYHGIVCHSLENGWDGSASIILDALNKMKFNDDASIVAIGSGFTGIMQGAPYEEIIEAFDISNKRLTVWTH